MGCDGELALKHEREGFARGVAHCIALLDARIAEEKELVRAICIGTVHPDQADRKEFTRWLQDTVIFHLGDMEKKLRAGIEGTRKEVG